MTTPLTSMKVITIRQTSIAVHHRNYTKALNERRFKNKCKINARSDNGYGLTTGEQRRLQCP